MYESSPADCSEHLVCHLHFANDTAVPAESVALLATYDYARGRGCLGEVCANRLETVVGLAGDDAVGASQ